MKNMYVLTPVAPLKSSLPVIGPFESVEAAQEWRRKNCRREANWGLTVLRVWSPEQAPLLSDDIEIEQCVPVEARLAASPAVANCM